MPEIQPAKAGDEGLVEFLQQFAGISTTFHVVLVLCLCGTVGVLGCMIYFGVAPMHCAVMLFLACGLFGSYVWVMSMLSELDEQEQQRKDKAL